MREFSANLGPLVFSFEWRLTLFSLILLPVLTSLGFWQLQRAEEKQDLEARYQQRMALPPVTLEQLVAAPSQDRAALSDRRVIFTGTLRSDHYVLLDNRLRDGRFGYEVIAFVATGSMYVPVNLGWLPGDPARRSFPVPALDGQDLQFEGRLYIPVGDAYLLQESQVPKTLPAVVQDYPAARFAQDLSQLLGNPMLPIMVRIAADHEVALRADWPRVNQSPQKHRGYAVQWFTMAAVLLIAFILRSSNLTSLVSGRTRN